MSINTTGVTPLVTVILPTFNRPQMLAESISSILNQTYKNFEIIVINDGGSPVSDVIASFSDDRIILFEFTENKGQAKARNIGLNQAKGEYIAYLDDDDIYYPEHLETLVNTLKNSEDKVAYTGANYANQEWITDRYVTISKEEISHPFDAQKLLIHNYIPFPNIMHKKELINITGIFDEFLSNSVHEDWDLLIRFSQYTNFIHINKITTEIRFGKNKISTTNKKRQFFLDTMIIIHERYKPLVINPDIFLQQKIIEWNLIKELFYERNINLESKNVINTCSFIIEKFTDKNNTLLSNLDNKDNIISHIQNILKEKEQYLTDLTKSINEKNLIINKNQKLIDEYINTINSNNGEILNFKNETANLKNDIKNLNNVIAEKNKILNDIYSSHAWWILRKYYTLIDILFPQNSNIRRKLKKSLSLISKNRIKQAFSYIKQYGFGKFINKIQSKFIYNYDLQNNFNDTPVVIPEIKIFEFKDDEDIIAKNIKISVIIPTKNGGDNFRRLIKSINCQKGFKEIEIIIVDSGSDDETLDVVKDYNLKLIEIKPENFSHPYSRNLAASHATGEYIFFTVQDALLPDKWFLNTFYTKLIEYNVVAVSSHEFVREDSDLFYNFMSHYHGKFMGLDKADRIMSMPENNDFESLRINSNLSNVACLINKEIFDKYKFREGYAEYAEDLDLGYRLIKDGYKLAMLSSEKIIHSHNRDAFYFLKRGYVDTLYISKIIPDYQFVQIDWEKLKKDIIFSYDTINHIITNISNKTLDQYDINLFIELFNNELNNILNQNKNIQNNNIDIFINKLYSISSFNNPEISNIVLTSCINFNYLLLNFIKQFNTTIDNELLKQYFNALIKSFAFYTGIYIAHCDLTTDNIKDNSFLEIIKDLKIGV